MQLGSLAVVSCLAAAIALPGLATADEDRPYDRDKAAKAEKQDKSVTDARAEAQLETTIALNRTLRASEIEVAVADQRATLTGTVDDELHAELAEQLALSIDGIEGVDNELVVDAEFRRAEPAEGERTFGQVVEDATITTAVKSKLLWSRHADGWNTEVETHKGVVTLSGSAESEEQRELAATMTQNTRGVVSVNNEVTVEPGEAQRVAVERRADPAADRSMDRDRTAPTADADNGVAGDVSDGWITTKIRASFLTTRGITSGDIDVETNEGVVMLSGQVDSEAERQLAVETAENIRGVRNVDARNLVVG